MANPIKDVRRNGNGVVTRVIVSHEENDFTFIYNNDKIICQSKPRMPEAVFNTYRKQLHAIFQKKKIVPTESIHRRNYDKDEKSRLISLINYRTYILSSGKISIIRTASGKDVVDTYDDIDSVIRAQNHIIKNYFGDNTEVSELDTLCNIFGITDNVQQLFLNWNYIEERDIEVSKTELENVIQQMKKYRNNFKVLSREQLQKILEMRDSLNRPNPGAFATRAVKTKKNLGKRKEEISGISQFVASRRHVLTLEKKQMQLNMILAGYKLKAILASSDKLFKNKETVNTLINQSLHLFQSIWANPYFEQIEEPKRQLDKAKIRIDSGNIKSCKNHISAAKDLLKAILI